MKDTTIQSIKDDLDLVLITGSMYSGKSKKLIQFIDAVEETGGRVACFKPIRDKRDLGVIKSRDIERVYPAYFIGDNGQVPTLPKGFLDTVNLIAVDEIQFLDEKAVDWIIQISHGYGIPVIFSGLSTDFRGDAFPTVTYLKKFSPLVVKVYAKCFCCGLPLAVHSRRVINNEIALHGEQVLCGDTETYIATCTKCDIKLMIGRGL